jgi:hypothetical protein
MSAWGTHRERGGIEETHSEPYTYSVNETVHEPPTCTVVDHHIDGMARRAGEANDGEERADVLGDFL